MPIDPSIPLSVQPLQLPSAAQVLGDPTSRDESGNLTPGALGRIDAVDPQFRAKLTEQLTQQLRNADLGFLEVALR
jgi:hypothetical protein